MNTYECRMQGGTSRGFCALGFGVCCVFSVTCNQEVKNNITYFVNPDFPDLSTRMTECSVTVKKIDPEIAQIRLDLIHFNLGQPNRKTGVCEEDVFLLTSSDSSRELKICGLNSGQHVYYGVETVDEVKIFMNLSKVAVYRFWEVRILQLPFTERAPAGCLQYHTGWTGTIQTMNFADNGRHLADQEYNVCVRQEEDACAIAYEPCHENSFRIAPNRDGGETSLEEEGSGAGAELTIDSARNEMGELCGDRIVLPCDSDDLLLPGYLDVMPGNCDLVHCGSSLCPSGQQPCRIETSATPFMVGVHFGPSSGEANPDDNLGMCLNYEQIACDNDN